jgi:hypothetical protein
LCICAFPSAVRPSFLPAGIEFSLVSSLDIWPDRQQNIPQLPPPGRSISLMPSMQPQRNAVPSVSRPINQPCRHPRVQIVAREEDTEFVECLECREVFESSEFKDMDI